MKFEDWFVALPEGTKFKKIVGVDRATADGDFTVEIHAIKTEKDEIVFIGEKITKWCKFDACFFTGPHTHGEENGRPESGDKIYSVGEKTYDARPTTNLEETTLSAIDSNSHDGIPLLGREDVDRRKLARPLDPEKISRLAIGVVQHWYEFGPEFGMDERIHYLDEALKGR